MAVVGGIIGSGIFINPAIVAQRVVTAPLTLGVWVLGGGIALIGAFCFGELGQRRPQAGGSYVYLREGLGPLPAFLYAWALLLVMATGAIAAVAVTFANYAAPLLGPPQLQAPLDGTIGVRLSRYLHLEVDLLLQKRVALPRSAKIPADAERTRDDLIVITDGGDRTLSDPTSAAANDIDRDLHRFRLTESRRMRSKEIHYYDHPALGVIATIMPFDPKKSAGAPAVDPSEIEPNEAPSPRSGNIR